MSLLDWDVLQLVGQAADIANVECYLVGGAVRDYLLGDTPKDYDFVCTDTEKLLRELSLISYTKYENYGTYQTKIGELELEFVNPRKEVYRTWDHHPQCTPGSIEDDILRRDFTINTLAIRIQRNTRHFIQIIDMTDRGLVDLDCFRLDTVNDPFTTFTEDPTRMLRAAVYAAKGFEPTAELMDGIYDCIDELDRIPPETIKRILERGLIEPNFIEILYSLGLLKKIFPEFIDIESVPQPTNHHKHDLLHHTFAIVEYCPYDLLVRWAALFHDIGKITTWKEWHDYKGHEYESAKIFDEIAERMKFSNDEKRIIRHLIYYHMEVILRAVHEKPIKKAKFGKVFAKHKTYLSRLKSLAEADIKAAGVHSKTDLESLEMFFVGLYKHIAEIGIMGENDLELAINGNDIMNILNLKSGKIVGIYKKKLEEYVLAGKIKNTKQALTAVLKKIAG